MTPGSLLGVLRTFSQHSLDGGGVKTKSTWGFENLFPTVRSCSKSDREVYLGF